MSANEKKKNYEKTNMADTGDELLDGDLDETAFDDLDGEQEDALLADDDFESYNNSRQVIFTETSQSDDSHTEEYHVIDQIQEGEEIIEDGEDDVLDIAVGDELDESELESTQGNNQDWSDSSSRIQDNCKDSSDPVGVSSSTHGLLLGVEGESDEEETDGRGSRFRAERTNVISIKDVTGGKSLSNIPDSLDKVKIPLSSGGGLRERGRGSRGSLRGRLGPFPPRGGMVGRGGPMRGPHMMPPSQIPPSQMPPPGHKIHVNPHFRGSMHQGQTVWDNERLPPPPGCENFGSPTAHPNKDVAWGGPMHLHHMGRPPMAPPHHHRPMGPYHGPQNFPPQHHQGYEDPYQPMIEPPQQSQPGRVVQFNDNTQLITVENQHFQRPDYDQNYGPPNNQFQPPPPPYNNNIYPPNQFNSPQRPTLAPQHPYPGTNPSSNYMGYTQPEFNSPQNTQGYPNYDNNWNSPPQQPMNQQFYPPNQPPQPRPPAFYNSPQFRSPHPPFPNRPPMANIRPPPNKQFQNNQRVSVMKRLAPRQPLNPVSPAKQMRFDHIKMKTPPAHTRSNLQEIKTVDNLPDTTTNQDPEPEVEEDEETKQYRLKIAEQKALREKILKEKEARRLAAILQKQKENQSGSSTNLVPVVRPPVQAQQQAQAQTQPQQVVRNLGRGRGQAHTVNRVLRPSLPKPTNVQLKAPGVPQVQIQNIQGTVYKIVKVRTKDGSIVTRKTPIALTSGGVTIPLTKTVNTMMAAANPNRKVVLNAPNQGKSATTSILRGTTNNSPRLISAKLVQGRTLFTVQTTSLANIPKTTAPQRLVIDKQMANAGGALAATPELPNSSLVTIDNLSMSTTQAQIKNMAKQAGNLTSFNYEPEKKKATLRFQKIQQAKDFHNKFNRKMVDLSRILVTVVPE